MMLLSLCNTVESVLCSTQRIMEKTCCTKHACCHRPRVFSPVLVACLVSLASRPRGLYEYFMLCDGYSISFDIHLVHPRPPPPPPSRLPLAKDCEVGCCTCMGGKNTLYMMGSAMGFMKPVVLNCAPLRTSRMNVPFHWGNETLFKPKCACTYPYQDCIFRPS